MLKDLTIEDGEGSDSDSSGEFEDGEWSDSDSSDEFD